MAGVRDDLQHWVGQHGGHPLADGAELLVAGPDDQRDGQRQFIEPVPQRGQRACPQAAERPRQPGDRAAQPIGVDLSRHLGGQTGEDGCPGPLTGKLADRHPLQALGKRLVGLAARRALGGIGEAGAGADQDQALDALGHGQRDVQRDPTAHRVAGQGKAGRRRPPQIGHHAVEVDRRATGRRTMPPDVGSQGPVAFVQVGSHAIPARAGVREAMEKYERGHRRHAQIMTATDSHLLLRAFTDELARCGVEHACTSPGSRNTPLLLALTRQPGIRCWSHIDERCAGFFAVGAAKASGSPVAVTCTSGTAVANLTPAVVEAWQARVPLIILTADRPPELRDVGAGQAIDQLKLFGTAVKWFAEVGIEVASAANLRWIRQLACRTFATAVSDRPGPVHLNFPLREPLVPDGPLPADPVPGRPAGRPWVTRPLATATPAPARPLPPRAVVVAGRDERRGQRLGAAAASFAARAGYPLLADPLSGARHGDAVITTYDLLLRDPSLTAALTPELIIRVGDLPTSKPLRTWLAALGDVPQLALDPEGAWQDPAAVVSEIETADPEATLAAWAPERIGDPDWLAAWQTADATVSAAIDEQLADELSEPLVARRLGDGLPPDATLFVASSMAIRDVELFLPPVAHLRVLSNRGANGIDGTVSSAFGVAAASQRPTVLLIGDVALAHDIGGLLAAGRLQLPLTIVLLNNDGGGIFHFLPASTQPALQDHVVTPHGLDFAHAAALYGCRYERAETAAGLAAAVARSIDDAQTTIVEVRTDREENLALHRRVADSALRRLAETGLSRPAGAAAPGA
ncbi:MAG: 2-succinyl-5-enolpyruvyl-6-hydroxy-3-cyclohexene-carboxylate synthase [Solirubrobacteraceae bacterium]|nr:2-succinyl-5-enolpyruvyl-6-hydroxy-3-cyclohexene-carboxylate synthase [Solirubrobacteraceae bacterium]